MSEKKTVKITTHDRYLNDTYIYKLIINSLFYDRSDRIDCEFFLCITKKCVIFKFYEIGREL